MTVLYFLSIFTQLQKRESPRQEAEFYSKCIWKSWKGNDMLWYTFKKTISAVWRMNGNRIRLEIERAVRRLFQHSRNEMIVTGRGKMRRSRCILKLKCRRLDGLHVVGKNTGRINVLWLEQLGRYRRRSGKGLMWLKVRRIALIHLYLHCWNCVSTSLDHDVFPQVLLRTIGQIFCLVGFGFGFVTRTLNYIRYHNKFLPVICFGRIS